MSKIVLGKSGGHNVKLDLDVLLKTRLLIQANSGGGKSFTIRRLAEQLFREIQIILIDPEGEFSTLREKYGYLLVGEGGETPADPRTAPLLAERLLELRASAVCDLYESFRAKPGDRRLWVRKFLEALVDAPKKLWRPLIVIVDEAHKFCPQETPKAGSQAERENIIGCKDAMISLATLGRKRRFCPIWATQRLAKVDKDASAELLNRMVGPTFEDVDIERAADLLSVARDEKLEFKKALRVLEPGNFFAIGRAISKERILIQVGPVETTHPEVDSKQYTSEPPPLPEKVRALLPKLADLPKEVEEKAKTVAEFQKQIKQLKAELRTAKAEQPRQPATKLVPDSRAINAAVNAATKPLLKTIEQFQRQARAAIDGFTKAAAPLNAIANTRTELPAAPAIEQVSEVRRVTPVTSPPVPRPARVLADNDGNISGPQQNILNQLAELEALGIKTPERSQLSLMAGYTNWRSGGFSEPLGSLIENGLVSVPTSGRVALTDAGRAKAQPVDAPLSTQELHERLCRKLGGPEEKLLREIISVYPDAISKEELGAKLGYTNVRSGGFSEPVGRLRSLGIIDYPQSGLVKAADWLYVEGAA